MTKFTKTLIASLFTFSAAGASAAAFQLAEVSSLGLGMAYAGNAAVADNASVVATNPALMTQFKQTSLSAGGIFVDADINIQGNIRGFDASHNNIVPNALVPNAYMVLPINESFSLGGGVNVNYGLKSEFKPTYSAGFFGGRTSLSGMNVNLSGAYKLTDSLSIGVGINAVHAKATLERNLGLLGQGAAFIAQGRAREAQKAAADNTALAAQHTAAGRIAEAQAATAEAQKYAQLAMQAGTLAKTYAELETTHVVHKLKGDKWGFGWNIGLVYEINPDHRLGVSYHSDVKLNFNGQYSNTLPVTIPNIIDTITGGATIGGRLALTLPAYWEIAGYHKFTEKFAMQYSYKHTDWHKFKALNAYANDGSRLFHKTENFNDSSRIALGFSYDVNPQLTLRTGIAYDESASVTNPSISIPDTDRTWYSVGATYRFTKNLSADLGYSHLRGSRNAFSEEGRGDFVVKGKANLYGLNVNYTF